METDSYLELYGTLIGWQWYDLVWDVLAGTGVIFIPFIVILISNWKAAAGGGSYGRMHDLALKRMEIEFYVALFVLIMTGPPVMALSPAAISYQPPPSFADPTPQTARADDPKPKSTYGKSGAFPKPAGAIGIPVWWYAIIVLSKGINHAIMAEIPAAMDVREIRRQASLASLSDARVRAEAAQFYADCFIPARSFYLRDRPDSVTVKALLTTYGEGDPDWMGSHVLRHLYYGSHRSLRQVAGWAYDPKRDVDYDPDLPHQWGQPTCEQWWSDPDKGLRIKILRLPENKRLTTMLAAAATRYKKWLGGLGGPNVSLEKIADWGAHAALENSRIAAYKQYQRDSAGGEDTVGIGQTIANVLGTAGAATAWAKFSIMLNVVKPMLPVAQAILLMVVYGLLPVIVVMGMYSLSMLMTVAIALFTIHFWTVLWKFAQWIDENLTIAMHPGTLDYLLDWVTLPGPELLNAATRALLVDILLAALMIGMPLIWSIMMAWVGIYVGKAMGAIVDDSIGPARSAGRDGAALGGETAGVLFRRRK
ncbi:MAG TPA: conjugal transfer protein TraG [Rhodobacteraceae bacterium]|nr:conjugal transfer protein TraG [Paracoccaceae bacterium]